MDCMAGPVTKDVQAGTELQPLHQPPLRCLKLIEISYLGNIACPASVQAPAKLRWIAFM